MKKFIYSCYVICSGIIILCYGCNTTYPSWNTAGPMQALGNKEKLWIFLQFNKQVAHPTAWILTSDSPTVYPDSHFQEILIFNKKHSLYKHFKVHTKDNTVGIDFNANIGFIFRNNNHFYAYKKEGVHNLNSLFLWDNDYFKLLPKDKTKKFILEYKIPKTHMSHKIRERLIAITKHNGWSYYSGRYFNGANLKWQKVTYSFELITKEDDENNFWLKIDTNPQQKGFPLLFKYKREYKVLTQEEYEKLPRSNYGHKNKR